MCAATAADWPSWAATDSGSSTSPARAPEASSAKKPSALPCASACAAVFSTWRRDGVTPRAIPARSEAT